MKFFYREKDLLVTYLKNTPVILVVLDLIIPFSSLLGTFYGWIDKKPYILLFVIFMIVIFFMMKIYYIKRTHIHIDNLYLNKKTFLSHMIMNISEVKRLKEHEKINNVRVNCLNIHFNIKESNNMQSDMNVSWNILCQTLNNDLLNYHVLCSKSESKRQYTPLINIQEFNCIYTANYDNLCTDLFNHLSIAFQDGSIKRNKEFCLDINLENYYRFMWNECEVLFINASMFGNIIDKINIKVSFNDSKIENKIISVYEINQNNFNRSLVKRASCQLCETGEYEFLFKYTNASGKFFLIEIPKSC